MTASVPHSTEPGALHCPSCGQPIPGLEQLIEEAVRARLAEVANALEDDHRQALMSLEGRPEADEEQLASARARHAETMDRLRMAMRQF